MEFLSQAGQWIVQALGALAGVELVVFLYALWQWVRLKIAGEAAREDNFLDGVLEREAQRLVRWAEQAFPGTKGGEKLNRVLRLMLSIFPNATEERLRPFVEEAVYWMNQEKAERTLPALDMAGSLERKIVELRRHD